MTALTHELVDKQVRYRQITDPMVLQAMRIIPRKLFVPKKYEHIALADTHIPLDHDQIMLNPFLLARILACLNLKSSDSVLEIGTGSGYSTAILANLAKNVTSIDYFPDFVDKARYCLQRLKIVNAEIHHADVFTHIFDRTFDAIILHGTVRKISASLLNILADNGTLVAPLGEAPIVKIDKFTKYNAQTWRAESLFETWVPFLIGEGHDSFKL